LRERRSADRSRKRTGGSGSPRATEAASEERTRATKLLLIFRIAEPTGGDLGSVDLQIGSRRASGCCLTACLGSIVESRSVWAAAHAPRKKLVSPRSNGSDASWVALANDTAIGIALGGFDLERAS